MVERRFVWLMPRPSFRQSAMKSSLLSLMPWAFWTGLTGQATLPPQMAELPPTVDIFSIMRTLRPARPALRAQAMPAKPEPMITTSNVSSYLATDLAGMPACTAAADIMAAEAATADLRKPRRLVSIWVILRILHSDWEHNRRGGFSRSLLVGDTAILLLRPPFGYIPRYGPCTYQSMQGLPFPFPKPLKTRPLRRKASCGRHVEGGFPPGDRPLRSPASAPQQKSGEHPPQSLRTDNNHSPSDVSY